MEEKNKKDGQKLALLLVICTFIGTIMLVFGVYSLFIKKDETPIKKVEDSQQEEQNENVNYVIKDCGTYNAVDFGKVIKNFKDYNGKQSKYDFSIMTPYHSTTIDLSEDGMVYLYNEENPDERHVISNISNVVSFSDSGEESGMIYFLLSNGDVYRYDIIYDYNDKNYMATKVEKIKNANKFVVITNCPIKDSGCDFYLGVIDNNNKFYSLEVCYE